MTVIDYNTAQYLMYVAGALEEERVPAQYLTNICTECGQEVTWALGEDPHIVMPVKEYATPQARHDANDWAVYVVIACEGYWMVNPNAVGHTTDTWQDWTLLPDDVNVEDFKD